MAENDYNKLFKEFYYNTYVELLNKHKDILDTDKIFDVLKNYAKNFYDVFKNSSIPVVYNEITFNQYHSVRIMMDSSSCYQFPWDLYLLIKNNVRIPDELILKFNFNYRLFFMYLYEYIFAIRRKIRPADVKILQYLSKYKFYRDSLLFYDKRRIAKFLKLDESTITKRIKYLAENRIFFDSYILNPFKLGYLVKMYLYSTNQQQSYEFLNTYTLVKLKLSNDDVLHIVALPYLFEDQLSVLTNLISYDINTITINTNLDQLNAKKEESFTNIPLWESEKFYLKPNVIFDSNEPQEWYSALIQKSTEIEDNSNGLTRISKYSIDTQLDRLTTILDYLTTYFTPKTKFEDIAEQLTLNKQDTIELFRFLITYKLGELVIQTKYIDCNARFFIILKYAPDKEINPIIENFQQNLLLLPYSHVFISDQIVAAIAVLPANWTVSFTTYLHLLEEAGIKLILTQIFALRVDYNLSNYKKTDILNNLRLILN